MTRFCLQVLLLVLVIPPLATSGQLQLPSRPSREGTIEVPMEVVALIRDGMYVTEFLGIRADGTAANLVAIPVDLNRDGVPELIVHGTRDMCAPVGNCPYYVFEKMPGGYRLLLEVAAVENLIPQKTVTKGHSDLWSWQHGSATESFFRYYKFDGTKYKTTRCYDHRYVLLGADHNGNPRFSHKPKITRAVCY
jgi:hypothetical protein